MAYRPPTGAMVFPSTPGSRTPWRALLLAALTVMAEPACGRRTRPEALPRPAPTACSEVITPTLARTVFDRLTAVRSLSACVLTDVATHGGRMEIVWHAGGRSLPPAVIVPRRCATPDAELHGAYGLEVPTATATRCGASLATVRAALGALPSALPGDDERDGSVGLLYLEAALLLSAFALAFALAVRAVRTAGTRPGAPSPQDLRSMALLGGAFVLALALRLAVTPAPANWYSDVLGAATPLSTGRFGPGGALYQAVLRAVLPWRDGVLFRANALLGALSVPLFLAVLRERRAGDTVLAAVGVLFALAPLHTRISASDSDHVLCSTLQIALLLAWVRAGRTRDLPLGALALLLVPATALVRAEAWWQLGTVPLWALLLDREETTPSRPWRTRALPAALYVTVWLVTGAVLYVTVALPSHHPFPERAGLLLATRQLVSQYATAARLPPRWVSPAAVVLALPGVLALLRRPGLLACVLASLAAAFIPLGRNLLHDGLLGTRYFLVTVPVFLITAGYGFDALLGLVLRALPARTPGTVPIALTSLALGALALATLLPALPAYRYHYAFQDEYAFLRRALTALPDGCTVQTLPIRDNRFDRDLDCCLDPARSSLVIAFPRLRFGTLDPEGAVLPTSSPDRCAAYYETAACAMHETDEVRARDARTYALVRARCARAHADPGLVPLAHAAVSPNATNGFFEATSPVVGLYRRRTSTEGSP